MPLLAQQREQLQQERPPPRGHKPFVPCGSIAYEEWLLIELIGLKALLPAHRRLEQACLPGEMPTEYRILDKIEKTSSSGMRTLQQSNRDTAVRDWLSGLGTKNMLPARASLRSSWMATTTTTRLFLLPRARGVEETTGLRTRPKARPSTARKRTSPLIGLPGSLPRLARWTCHCGGGRQLTGPRPLPKGLRGPASQRNPLCQRGSLSRSNKPWTTTLPTHQVAVVAPTSLPPHSPLHLGMLVVGSLRALFPRLRAAPRRRGMMTAWKKSFPSSIPEPGRALGGGLLLQTLKQPSPSSKGRREIMEGTTRRRMTACLCIPRGDSALLGRHQPRPRGLPQFPETG